MTLETNLQNYVLRAATESKALRTLLNGNQADLSSLLTGNKTSLVGALNELKGALDAAASGAAGINDAVTDGTSTWSSTKIANQIDSSLAALVDGSPAALDTLNELAAALGDDANFASTINSALTNRLRVDAVQGLTAGQKAQGLSNLGAASAADLGNPNVDLVGTFEAGLV